MINKYFGNSDSVRVFTLRKIIKNRTDISIELIDRIAEKLRYAPESDRVAKLVEISAEIIADNIMEEIIPTDELNKYR